MIDIKKQEEMLMAIGRILLKKIEVYAIGGTATMLRGLKNSTLDVDLVFNKYEDRKEFIEALKKLGAKEYDSRLVYGLKDNAPLMLEFDNCRFDMFMNKIITSYFSDGMKERSGQTHEFANLIIKVADPGDIIIMKSVTSRAKDIDDIISIINNNSINWNTVVDEAKEQVRLGKESAIMNLGEKLERLANQKVISIPKDVHDKIWKLFHRQVKKKAKK